MPSLNLPWGRSAPAAWLGVMLALLLVPDGVRAQAPAPRPLTLSDLYRAVDSLSPMVRAARWSSRAAAARVPGAGRLSDPRLELQFMNRELPGLGLSDPLGMTQLQLTQMLPVAGQLGLSREAAAAAAGAADARIGEAALEQRARAAMAFYDLYQASRRLAIGAETVQLLEDLVTTLTAMYGVGEARQADVLRAQVELGRMEAELDVMRGMRAKMAARLAVLLDQGPAFPLGEPILPDFPESLLPADSLLAIANRDRPMLTAGALQVTEAELLARRARREIWPDLEVGIAYGQRPMPEGGTDRMLSLMIGASVPIWAGSRQFRMRDETAAMHAMAQADLDGMRADTRGRVLEALAELDQVRTLRRRYREALLPQAEATVASARSAYQVGSVDFMTLLDALMGVNRFREEMHRLEAAEGQAFAELEMLTGRPLVSGQPLVPALRAGGQR